MSEAIEVPRRYEMKYRILPEMVAPIRRAALAACAPDEAGRDGRYIISSLYLDSPQRRFYRESRERVARRYKLRVRRYSSGPLFLEIKRKVQDIIDKTRVAIPAEAWPGLLHDPRVLPQLDLSDKARRGAEDFVNRCIISDARPAVVVRYERDALVSTVDDYGRVTFDHRLMAGAPQGWAVPIDDGEIRWRPFDGAARYALGASGVVLELKCLTRVPHWFKDLVHRFHLQRSGFSKYCGALEAVEGASSSDWLRPMTRDGWWS